MIISQNNNIVTIQRNDEEITLTIDELHEMLTRLEDIGTIAIGMCEFINNDDHVELVTLVEQRGSYSEPGFSTDPF